MLKVDDIKEILRVCATKGIDATENDVIFVILCGEIAFKNVAYKYAYPGKTVKKGIGEALYATEPIKQLITVMTANGYTNEDVADLSENELTREQNKQGLIELIYRTERLMRKGRLEEKDGLRILGDLRVKLNDRFEMEAGNEERRIIVVPAKHDMVCPHTNRECYQWPSKEACIEKYNLKEK